MNNQTYSTIEDIQIGDILSHNNKVIGKYECNTKDIQFFNIDNVVISPRIICSKNGSAWNKIYNLGKQSPLTFKKGYHLITENHTIQLSDNLFIRDFIETSDEKIQNYISDIVLQHISPKDPPSKIILYS